MNDIHVYVEDCPDRTMVAGAVAESLDLRDGQRITDAQAVAVFRAVLFLIQCEIDIARATEHPFMAPMMGGGNCCDRCGEAFDYAKHKPV